MGGRVIQAVDDLGELDNTLIINLAAYYLDNTLIINLAAYYNVVTPDDTGANWQLRAQWTFLFPTH